MAKKKRSSHRYDYEKAQRQLDKLNTSMESNFSWWKAEQGDNTIRVLPPISEDADFPYEEVFLHYGIDDVPITCLGAKCPICAFIKQTGKSKQFKDIRKVRRLFFQLIDRDMEVPEPVIWSAGSKFLQYFLPIFCDVDEYGDITDLEEGTDIVVNRQGTTKTNTKYSFRIKRHPSSVSEDDEEIDEIWEAMVDLATVSKKLSIDEVDDLLHDYLDDKDIDEDFFDEDNEPPRRSKKRKRKPKREVEEEEEEEEEKPKSNKRKKSSNSNSTSKKATSRKTRSAKTESEDEGGEEEESDEIEDEPEKEETPKKRKPRKEKEIDPEEEDEPEEKPKKASKSRSSNSNDNILDSLLEELDGELADLNDEEDDE